jgi:uroporphyrinogen decarboxylase
LIKRCWIPFYEGVPTRASSIHADLVDASGGRYMQEYREVREKTTFLELCKNPSLATEVTVTCC